VPPPRGSRSPPGRSAEPALGWTRPSDWPPSPEDRPGIKKPAWRAHKGFTTPAYSSADRPALPGDPRLVIRPTQQATSNLKGIKLLACLSVEGGGDRGNVPPRWGVVALLRDRCDREASRRGEILARRAHSWRG